MIEKIKTVTYAIRSHGHKTVLSGKGTIEQSWDVDWNIEWNNIKKPVIKKLIWHLEDVLRCMNRIEKEKKAKKDEQTKSG